MEVNKDHPITGTLYQYMNSITSLLAGALFYVFLTKSQSTTFVGAYVLVTAVYGLFNSIFSFGLTQAGQHFISFFIGQKNEGAIKEALKKILTLTLLLSLLAALTIELLAGGISIVFFHSPFYLPRIRLVGVLVLFLIPSGILNGIFLGLQKFKLAGILGITGPLISYSIALSLLLKFHTLRSIIIGWIIGYFISVLIYGIFLLRVSSIRPTTGSINYRQIGKYSWPIVLSSVVGFSAMYIDRFVVSIFLDVSTLGIYNVALLVATTLPFIISPIGNVLLPKLSEFFSTSDRGSIKSANRVSSNFYVFIYVPTALMIASLGQAVILILSKGNYVSASLPMDILLFVSALFVIGNSIGQTIYAIKETRILLVSATMALLSNIGLSFLLIPHFGMVGAAVANSSVTAVSFAVQFLYIRKKNVLSFDLGFILRTWISSIVVFFFSEMISFVISDIYLRVALVIVLGYSLYLGLLKMMGGLPEEMKSLLNGYFSSRIKFVSFIITHM